MPDELRVDPVTGAVVRVVPSREGRPTRPTGSCPFCVGGAESPEPYEVRAFSNRWPAFAGNRCEVVLYGSEHDGTLATLGAARARAVVDLWAARTDALGARDDVAYVHVFENHGPEVGATIAHPHGQVFAYDRVPPVPAGVLERLERGAALHEPGGERVVVERDGWRAWVPWAATHPFHVRLAPLERRPDLPSLADDERAALGSVLVELLGRVESVFDPPMPYLLWWVQRPTDGRAWPGAWLHLELVSPWRAPGLPRHLAAGEVGSGVFINPLGPDEVARTLRGPGA